jgi:predicted  nucleic acid-binding Zn-ribbon protein
MIDDLRKIQKAENEIIGLREQFSKTMQQRPFWQEALRKARELEELIHNKSKIENNIQDFKNQIYEMEKSLDHKANEISKEKKTLNNSRSVGWLTRKWKGLPEPDEQETKIDNLEEEYGRLGIQLDDKRNALSEWQLKVTKITHAINAFQQKYGGSVEEIQHQASKNETRIKELTQTIHKQTSSTNAARIRLVNILKQRILILKEAGLIESIPDTAEAMLDKIIKAYEQAKIKIAGQYLGELKTKHKDLNDRIANIESEIEEIEEKLKKIEELIISEADIVATTLTRAYLRESVQNRRFDTVILDEASMAPIPALWVAAGLADNNAVVVGDPKQLPPIVISEKELPKKWLGRDIFEEAGLNNYQIEAEYLTPLWKQYRMHPSISLIANDLVYNNRLENGKILCQGEYCKLDDDRCDEDLLSWYDQGWGYDFPVLLIDTGPINAWVTSVSRGNRSSRLNFLSATICVDLAGVLIKDRPKQKLDAPSRILIISPYRPHARLVEILIKEQGLQNEVRSGTIHNFQGSEADLVIFDLVNDEPHFRVGMFIPALDESMRRLINVALTRAKRRLFIIGDFDYIQKLAKKAFVGSELIPFIKERFPCVDAKFVVPEGLADRSAKAQNTVFGGGVEPNADRIIMTQDKFYSFFRDDINKAKERVVIYSAFITQDRLAIMEPSLRAAVERGVMVFIITKALEDRGKRELNTYRMLEKTLEKWSVVVIHKRHMHEKLAIIDNSILWIGSLNILSFSSTQEIMERRYSKNVVQDYIKTLRLNELLREYEAGFPTCPICKREVVASEGRDDPYYWRCVLDGCYSRSIDQPPIEGGIITCSNCGGRVEYGEWGGKPHWRCVENRMHRQKIAKTHLMLPEMRKIIPKREIKKLERAFGIDKQSTPNDKAKQTSLFDQALKTIYVI